ncbi:glycosyltransferase family 4 protein [Salicola sp. Rm-C-2C1-2]|uniref:glycosyltransferase family 4 protein n=1 Tax=Salicola sp. Rm-C-2C1-2 TaxID=3141321 RepID=UPI0032E44463
MKILFITKTLLKGGSASGSSNLITALEIAGHEVIPYGGYENTNSYLQRTKRFIERVIDHFFFDANTHCTRLFRPTFELQKIVKKHNPDIVQLGDVSGNVISFSELSNLPCPVVHRMSDFWPYHGPSHYALPGENDGRLIANWFFKKTIFNGLNLPTVRVAPSHWLAKSLRVYPSIKAPIRVIPNAVQLPQIFPGSRPDEYRIRFGFISNQVTDPRKGFYRVLHPLLALSKQGFEVSLHVYGRIAEREKTWCSGLDITYHGSFSRENICEVFDTFDILLCPSRLDNSPNTVCEALSYGRPVIAQSGTGMDSYIDKSYGALIDFWHKSDEVCLHFTTKCKQIILDYDQFSCNARQYVNDNLSPAVIGEKYTSLYREIIDLY